MTTKIITEFTFGFSVVANPMGPEKRFAPTDLLSPSIHRQKFETSVLQSRKHVKFSSLLPKVIVKLKKSCQPILPVCTEHSVLASS